MLASRLASLLALLLASLVLLASSAAAEQPRDYMFDFQPDGTSLLIDWYGTGGMLTLEHRLRFYGSSNDLTLAGGLVPAYPLGETFARADLRILFLSVGLHAAYRTVWRDLSFEPGENGEYCAKCDRASRRDRDHLLKDTPGSDAFGWGEARASLYFPFNDYVLATTAGALRYEDRRDRSYDWFYTSVFDHGMLGRWEANIFVKHPDWGGIGPYVQLLMLPRAGEHEAQWAFGFNAVTRLGILPRNDLLFLTFLTRPGDGKYGQHSYFSPIRALLIYRMSLELWTPPRRSD
jgi:opacity protein-like surface antigen